MFINALDIFHILHVHFENSCGVVFLILESKLYIFLLQVEAHIVPSKFFLKGIVFAGSYLIFIDHPRSVLYLNKMLVNLTQNLFPSNQTQSPGFVLTINFNVMAKPGTKVHFNHCSMMDFRVHFHSAFLLLMSQLHIHLTSFAAVVCILASPTVFPWSCKFSTSSALRQDLTVRPFDLQIVPVSKSDFAIV